MKTTKLYACYDTKEKEFVGNLLSKGLRHTYVSKTRAEYAFSDYLKQGDRYQIVTLEYNKNNIKNI